jgi:hypothetical protein
METKLFIVSCRHNDPQYVIANSHLEAAQKYCIFDENFESPEQEEIRDLGIHKFWAKEISGGSSWRITVLR